MGDNIKKPDHYCDGRKYEPKDVIRDWGLNFNLGSCVKYISRAGRKGDKLEDLRKAKQFLEFEIEALETKEHKDDIGMSCREAAAIGEAIAKGFEEGFKEAEENSDIEIERKTSWYTNGILGQWYYYQNIPDEYKARVIDRIIEMIRNGELDIMDISDDLYYECVRSRSSIANSEYRKTMDVATKSTEDTITITFNIKED